MTRGARPASFVRRTAIWIPIGVIGLLSLPMLSTNRSFGHDWTLHLWLLRQQQVNITALGHPGLLVSATGFGAFYPMLAFVGSGVYSVGGYLAIVLGGRPILAYKLLYIAGLCVAYGGMTWLSVQRGLRGWRSQVAGLVFVTEAYVVTDLAGRGDLGEFVALASIPFVLAATYAVLTSARCRRRHLLAVAAGAFLLTGSHNITLLWGTVFIALLAAATLVAYAARVPRPVPWRRVTALIASAAIGTGLNAWYLFPDLAFGLDTTVARKSHGRLPTPLDHFGFLLDPLRLAYSPVYRDIRMSLPWLFIAWAVLAGSLRWRAMDKGTQRLFAGVVAITSVFVVLIVARSPWRLLPRVLSNVQFTWRLGGYVVICAALLVIVALEWNAIARDSIGRIASMSLVVLLLFNTGLATWQVWRVRPGYVHGGSVVSTNDSFAATVVAKPKVAPPSWREFDSFRDQSAPVVAVAPGRAVKVPLAAVHGTKFAGTLRVPDGRAPFSTNIAGGPRFVRMTGIHAVGRTAAGFVVAVRDGNVAVVGPVAVTIQPAETAVLRAGWVVSILSGLGLAALLAWPRRRSAPPGRS